jgi:hypothetical protein
MWESGRCLNFGLLGQCSKGCSYKHEMYTIPEERQSQIAKGIGRGMAAMKAVA